MASVIPEERCYVCNVRKCDFGPNCFVSPSSPHGQGMNT